MPSGPMSKFNLLRHFPEDTIIGGETRAQKELQPGAAEAETKVRQLRTCAAHASSKPHSPARLVCNVLYSILLAEWFCKSLMTSFKL